MERGGSSGGVEPDEHPCRRMKEQRGACERRLAHARDRTAAAASAFRDALLSARSLTTDTVSHRENLSGLKDQLRRLEAGLAEALSVQVNNGSKFKLTGELVLNATTTREQLRSLVMDQKTRRDEYVNVITNQLEAIDVLEANIDVTGKKKLDEAIMWYRKFLGFQVVGGEGVTFVFSKLDMQNPDGEYFFCIKVNKDGYNLVRCVPLLEDSEELLKDLNCTNDLFKFVRIMRERFHAAASQGVRPARSFCSDTSSATTSSSPASSVDTTSKSTANQSRSQNRAREHGFPAKKGVPPRSASSPLTTLSSARRSPRFVAAAAGKRH